MVSCEAEIFMRGFLSILIPCFQRCFVNFTLQNNQHELGKIHSDAFTGT